MKTIQTATIPVRVDKSHLIVIGERLYAQSLELIRELVSNAYDADATRVDIELTEYALKVKDDGSGMDEAGLKQYLTIGSEEKKFNAKSPRFGRKRIGRFGIGKFAVLSACDVFTVLTQKEGFAAKLTFDRNLWNAMEEWSIPIHFLEYNAMRGSGTVVELENLKKQLTLPDIERFLRERLPLSAPNFNVFLNGKRIMQSAIPGKTFPVKRKTDYGFVQGEIVIPNFPQAVKEYNKGIECFVDGVFIRKETFGFEYHHGFGSSRITGRIHGDFLPITTDRSRFVEDSPEYETFVKIMKQEVNVVLKQLRAQATVRADKKADGVLKEALSHIRKALKKNPEFAPKTRVLVPDERVEKNKSGTSDPSGSPATNRLEHSEQETTAGRSNADAKALIGGGEASASGTPDAQKDLPASPAIKKAADRSSKKVRVRTMDGRQVSARKMKIGQFSVVCRAEELGEVAPPVLWDSGIIFINRNHPLYKRFVKKSDLITLYVTQLISQEIAKIRATNVEEAFRLQNKILADAWV